MDPELKAEFNRLHKKLNEHFKATKKEHWMGPSWVTDLTGWDAEKLRQARENKLVEFKRSKGGGYLYKLESIPEVFIIKNPAFRPGCPYALASLGRRAGEYVLTG